MKNLQCPSCLDMYESSEQENEIGCPQCGEILRWYPGPSRGSAAEILGDELAESSSEKERDVYRTLLHLLACNLLTKNDIHQFIHFGNITENLDYALHTAYDNSAEDEEDALMVCPNCESEIKSYAQWFTQDKLIEVIPKRRV